MARRLAGAAQEGLQIKGPRSRDVNGAWPFSVTLLMVLLGHPLDGSALLVRVLTKGVAVGGEALHGLDGAGKDLVQLPAQHFKKRLLLDPTFLHSTAKTLAEKLHQINYLAPANFHYSVKERLATHFLEHCDKNGTLKPKMNQLALRFGISYRHLNLVIKQMIEEGLIQREGRVYTILDAKRMNDLSIKHAETVDR